MSLENWLNTIEYDQIGRVTVADAEELLSFVEDLKFEVQQWLKKNYPDFAK